MPRTYLFPRVWRGVGLSIFTRFLYTPTAGAIAALSLKAPSLFGGGVDGGNYQQGERENEKANHSTYSNCPHGLFDCRTLRHQCDPGGNHRADRGEMRHRVQFDDESDQFKELLTDIRSSRGK